MPTTPKVLFRGAATTNTSTSLYTVPSLTNTIVTDIVVTNTASAVGNFTLTLNSVRLAEQVTVGANDSTVIQIKQVLAAGQAIQGGASAATINFHISGVEIS